MKLQFKTMKISTTNKGRQMKLNFSHENEMLVLISTPVMWLVVHDETIAKDDGYQALTDGFKDSEITIFYLYGQKVIKVIV